MRPTPPNPVRMLMCVAALLTCAGPPLRAAPSAGLPEAIQATLAAGVNTSGEKLYAPAPLAALYPARRYAPGWVSDAGPRPYVLQLLAAIRDSQDDGLKPADYHLDAIAALLHQPAAHAAGPAEYRQRLATLELLASDAFLALAGDALNGRVDPAQLEPPAGFDARRRDPLPALRQALAGSDPQTLLRALFPQTREYQALRSALAYEYQRAAGAATPPVPDGDALRAGETSARTLLLIAKLEADGELAPGSAPEGQFNAAVEAAVRRYQTRHGLAPDGVVGHDTFAALNEPRSARINRLRVNLERLRWLPHQAPPTRLVVNIAGFDATLYEQDQPALTAAAIVGETGSQTPEFSGAVQYLVINPPWEVPPGIGAKEILPAARRDPDYLTRNGYEVLAGSGETERVLDPHSLNWKRWNAATFPYRFRQRPGSRNALGRVKFMFPNRYNVYLHDTPAQGLFAARERAFSHGCVRVSQALQLAEELLRLDGEPQPAARLAAAVASGTTQQINLRRAIPIYLVYQTAWVNAAGVLESRLDIYGRDPQVLSALDAPPATTAFSPSAVRLVGAVCRDRCRSRSARSV